MITQIVLVTTLSMFYILYIYSLMFTYKYRKRMKTNWYIALLSIPFAPIIIFIDYIAVLKEYWRN